MFYIGLKIELQRTLSEDPYACLTARSDLARRRASTRPIKLMLKKEAFTPSASTRVDARQLIYINQMSDVSLSYT